MLGFSEARALPGWVRRLLPIPTAVPALPGRAGVGQASAGTGDFFLLRGRARGEDEDHGPFPQVGAWTPRPHLPVDLGPVPPLLTGLSGDGNP